MNTVSNNSNVNFGVLQIKSKYPISSRYANIKRLYDKSDRIREHVLTLFIDGEKICYKYDHPTNSHFDSFGEITREGVEKLLNIKSDKEVVKKLQELVQICRKRFVCLDCIGKVLPKDSPQKETMQKQFLKHRDAELKAHEIFQHVDVFY